MKFKNVLLIFIFMTGFTQVKSQDCCECDIDSYGGVKLSLTTFAGQTAFLGGGFGGWNVNKNLMIGGGGFGSFYPIKIPNENKLAAEQKFNIGYGGLLIDYKFNPQNKFVIHSNVLLGFGGFEYGNSGSGFFVAEPSINATYKISKYFSLGTFSSYRFVNAYSGILNNKELSGFSGGLTFIFGNFTQTEKTK